MGSAFFDKPILNSPYDYPKRHWELDETGQPTEQVIETRRLAAFVSPIPRAKKQSGPQQTSLVMDDLSSDKQQYAVIDTINQVRKLVGEWRAIADPSKWGVTPETAKLLQHWRHHNFSGVRPFFCQIEAVETLIWVTEVAPNLGKEGKDIISRLGVVNAEANPELLRTALKLATGAGKTTVMAMLIAWQTVNAVRHTGSKRFTRGFLIIAPGLTIKDRLRVLQPNDPDSYYQSRELVPPDMIEDINKAKIVITNYHAFKLRERIEVSKVTRGMIQGRGPEMLTLETEGQMMQRVMPELMGMKGVLLINDEAHHCYREKPDAESEDLKGDDLQEAKKRKEAARLWISGIEAINRKLGVNRVVDLSATPFFLKGSGYAEGTLFPWTVSDFALMDAIECGIVKLPRVPITDNSVKEQMPIFRNLWEHISKDMPKKGKAKSGQLDPLNLPTLLKAALDALYGHYAKTYLLWQEAGISVPPCFIIVCNNTSASKLVYDYISGFSRENEDGSSSFQQGRLALFQNYDEHGNPLAQPKTLLIDSEQLESGDALDENFRQMAAVEIDRFKREIIERTGDARAAENIEDSQLLREVMNTVGKPGTLGESVRCVVSVSMLTEGWDANTVTHILGVRAFGTQLLCEQVIGRALRRQSYELNDENLFNVEYADILGIPFDFTAQPVPAPPKPPRETIHVKAMRPERDHLEIQFPRVQGYRIEPPSERLTATFDADSVLTLTPELVGPSITNNQGILGEGVVLSVAHLADIRPSTIVYRITERLLYTKWRDPGEEPKLYLFGQLKRIVKAWLDECLVCKGEINPAQILYLGLADMACERITAAITKTYLNERPVKALLDPFNHTGSTNNVGFNTSNLSRWKTDSQKCHINWAILDSDWEGEFCRVAEEHPKVKAYVKNHNLGLEVPYRFGSEARKYIPDFIVKIDDGHGEDDLLNLIVEVKGYRRIDAQDKKNTMDVYWVPGVNNLQTYGRWAFSEFTEVFEMGHDFKKQVEAEFDKMIQSRVGGSVAHV